MNDYSAAVAFPKPALSECDREPIHILGHIQQFGYLFAVSSDWIIAHVSANVEDCLGAGPHELIGAPLSDYFEPTVVDALRRQLRMLHGENTVSRLFGLSMRRHGDLYDFAVHVSGDFIIIEAEPAGTGARGEHGGQVHALIDRLAGAESVSDIAHMAARQVSALTGFDRVMVYRFDRDGSGEVIAETKREDLESFLTLRYPRTDIPEQARELYKRNLIRIISDVNEQPVPILPPAGPSGGRLDLSLSKLRAVSRIHIEYLQNMGVGASMSISILHDGELWGMFVGHHYSARILSFELRTAAELYGQLFSFVLAKKLNEEERLQDRKARALHDRLMSQIAEGDRLDSNFDAIADAFRSVIACDGIAISVDGRYQRIGVTPTKEEFTQLSRFLSTGAASRVYNTDRLPAVYPPAAEFQAPVAGILAIPVSRQPRDYIVCFRKEVAQTVTWAGNPEKAVSEDEQGVRLSPRKSFAKWQETVTGRSKVFTQAERRAAEQLRMTLLEVVLRLTDAAARESGKAAERQELLIAELNHRVRNILNLIRGLVAQSQSDEDTVASFSEKIGGRIHALARAHDQVTKEHWAPAPLSALIATEKEAYLGGKQSRVSFSGDDCYLKPNAFTALSLVIHELMTNSAKYGALSDSSGHVDIVGECLDGGTLKLTWREIGGPPVQAPTRRGFGTTIIERSVPFELGGTADIEFAVTGLKAVFTIPPQQLGGRAQTRQEAQQSVKTMARISGNVLILEDNMIIAMDAEDMLKDLGAARVFTAGNVTQALGIIEDQPLSFALLDVNLGAGTSEDAAQALTDRGVPFTFSTGYGDAHGLTDKFPDAGVLQKPIDEDALAKVVKSLVG